MMVLTRSASSSPVKKTLPCHIEPSKTSVRTSSATGKPAHPQNEPLRLLISPQGISSSSRIVLLPNPIDVTGPKPTRKRFLFCPRTGLHELTKISAPQEELRSILFSPSDAPTNPLTSTHPINTGYISKQASYMTATPFDLAFLLLPFLSETTSKTSKSTLFQSIDDILEDLVSEHAHFAHVFSEGHSLVEDAMGSICDTVEAGDEKMYRFSLNKTLAMVVSKAQRVVRQGLPKSLEERFVTNALEVPLLSVKREDTSISISSNAVDAATPDTLGDSFDSQSTATLSVAPSADFSQISVASSATTLAATDELCLSKDDGIPEHVKHLQRVRTAFNFITASYTSPQLSLTLSEELEDSSQSGLDFAPLNDHLDKIQKLKIEAAAAHSFSEAGRKRGSLEDEEEAESRAEKKRKLEEDEKRRKANLSRGVRDLAKVNVKGMKKMSDFFGKKPTAKT